MIYGHDHDAVCIRYLSADMTQAHYVDDVVQLKDNN